MRAQDAFRTVLILALVFCMTIAGLFWSAADVANAAADGLIALFRHGRSQGR